VRVLTPSRFLFLSLSFSLFLSLSLSLSVAPRLFFFPTRYALAAFRHHAIYNPMTGKTECVDPRCDGSTHKVEWEPYVGSLSVARQGQNAKLAQGALNPHDLSAMSPTPPSQLPNHGHALSGQQPQPRHVPVTRREVAANLPPRGTTVANMTVTQRMLVVETHGLLAAPEKEKDFFSSLLSPGFLSFSFTEIVAGRSRNWWFGDRAPKKNIFAWPERQPLSPGGEKWPFSLAYTVKKD